MKTSKIFSIKFIFCLFLIISCKLNHKSNIIKIYKGDNYLIKDKKPFLEKGYLITFHGNTWGDTIILKNKYLISYSKGDKSFSNLHKHLIYYSKDSTRLREKIEIKFNLFAFRIKLWPKYKIINLYFNKYNKSISISYCNFLYTSM